MNLPDVMLSMSVHTRVRSIGYQVQKQAKLTCGARCQHGESRKDRAEKGHLGAGLFPHWCADFISVSYLCSGPCRESKDQMKTEKPFNQSLKDSHCAC